MSLTKPFTKFYFQLRMLTVTGFSQLMAIRLDLGENSGGGGGSVSNSDAGGEGGEGSSHVDLCIIRYGDDGVLQMSPDFSSGKMPYKIDVKTGERKDDMENANTYIESATLQF